jgi:hypothetical protein
MEEPPLGCILSILGPWGGEWEAIGKVRFVPEGEKVPINIKIKEP